MLRRLGGKNHGGLMKTVTAIAGTVSGLLFVIGCQAVTSSAAYQVLPVAGSGGSAEPDPVVAHQVDAQPLAVAPEDLTAVVRQYCVACHNDALLTGNLSLMSFEVPEAAEHAEVAEKMILKLRTHMMPPPGMPRPGGDTLTLLVETLEQIVDDAADDAPRPGTRTFQRLNQADYRQEIYDLFGLEVEAGDWLPADSYLSNFNNMSAVQAMSPTLLNGYLNAATVITRMAVGEPDAVATPTEYKLSLYASQHPWDHVEGAPFGTRGGMAVMHSFLADGEYQFEMGLLGQGGTGSRFEDIDVSINGERVALMGVERGVNLRERVPGVMTEPILVPAGQHRVSAAFVRRAEGPYEDLQRPHDWSMAGHGASSWGTTIAPHLQTIRIIGPYNPTGVSETESRRRIFTCYPDEVDEQRACAESILTRLASEAYRRDATERDVEQLMQFYDVDAEQDGFEVGIRTGIQAILVSPHFVFRVERQPDGIQAGEVYQVGDVELASRLSFFLWGAPPDDELLELANEGRLNDPRVLEEQTRRMLADPRSESLGRRFASQWLRLQDMDKVHPDAFWFPNYDQNVADAMKRETAMFFNNLVQEDRSALELYTADYTFVNERLARHYGIPGVVGPQFQRVDYPDANRRGVLGHGSVQVLTSLGNRTSPVLRGKWVMEVLLGTTPPPPPPGVPTLEETAGNREGRMLTTRERMEQHRRNPICMACHQYMDPIGLALDNFDVTGQLRIRENGMTLDTRGTFYDGSPVTSPQDLTEVLLKRPLPLMRNFALNLLAYAVGRTAEYTDMPTVRAITEEARQNDYRMATFVLGVVNSDPFRMKQAEIAADAEAGAQ